MTASLRRDVVILACAISAGIHGALAPEHFGEGAGAGLGFVAAAALLAVMALLLTVRPHADLPLALVTLTLGGLIGSYVVALTTGLPLLHPEPEPVDGLALVTKAIEAAGLVVASTLLRHRPAVARPTTERNPTWTRPGPTARSRYS